MQPWDVKLISYNCYSNCYISLQQLVLALAIVQCTPMKQTRNTSGGAQSQAAREYREAGMHGQDTR